MILMIYAMFHPGESLMCVVMTIATASIGLSYSQGMNDILARFLLVFHNEVDSYWAFVHYMEHKKSGLC